MVTDLIGDRVISITNDDEQPQIGTLIRFTKYINTYLPVVLFESDNKEYLCMGIIIPYTEEMYNLLVSLPYKKRWPMIRDISIAIQITHVKRHS